MFALSPNQSKRRIRILVFTQPLPHALHLLDWVDAEDGETGGDHDGDRPDGSESCPGHFGIAGNDETQCRRVPALRPQKVELRSDFPEIERYPVWFVRLRGAATETSSGGGLLGTKSYLAATPAQQVAVR